MISTEKTQVVKNMEQKTMTVTRSFNAPVPQVWRAWTEPELLDQWWAPKPWTAKTKTMDFKVGGKWQYGMAAPDAKVMHWSIAEFTSITQGKSFEYDCAFCDEDGNKSPEFSGMHWHVNFIAAGEGTRVKVVLSFDKTESITKMLERGFETGFTSALGNLDQLLGHEK